MMQRFSGARKETVFRSDTGPLTLSQVQTYAPSVLAAEPHNRMSEKYGFISTGQVIDGLRKQGFQPFEVRQTKVRDLTRREFTRHMLRLRHPEMRETEDGVPELVLLNSHDGSSSYQLFGGFFRFICSNGLIAGTMLNDIRIRHTPQVVDRVIEGSFRVVVDTRQMVAKIDRFRALPVSERQQLAFATAAASLRWEPGQSPMAVEALLQATRPEDRAPHLWNVLNRVQEKLIKGGISGRTRTGKRMTTRSVAGVNENVKLNRALWMLADSMAEKLSA